MCIRDRDKLPYASDYLAGHADGAVALVMDKSGAVSYTHLQKINECELCWQVS